MNHSFRICFSTFLFFILACKSELTPIDTSQLSELTLEKSVVDSLETPLQSELIKPIIGRDSLNQLLDKPFDLLEIKKKIGSANSGGGLVNDYFYLPPHNGFYYQYFLIHAPLDFYYGSQEANVMETRNPLELTVYKQIGPKQYKYTDETEVLIQLETTRNYVHLPNLAFVGLPTDYIIQQIGEPSFEKENCLVYTFENKALILGTLGHNSMIVWLKYLVLKKPLIVEDEFPNLYHSNMFM